MRMRWGWYGAGVVVLVAITTYVGVYSKASTSPADPSPRETTLIGTYGCLPHKNTGGPQTEECAFGIHAEDGVWYVANFGQSSDAMDQFASGARVRAHGFVVPIEALSTDQWMIYEVAGVFTTTSRPERLP